MEPIKGAVEQLLAGLKARGPAPDAEEIILSAFSKKELAHIRVSPARQGRVRIVVDSSAWLYHFNLKKKELAGKICAGLPGTKEVSFVIGEVGEKRKGLARPRIH
jgi:hypothetical protein